MDIDEMDIDEMQALECDLLDILPDGFEVKLTYDPIMGFMITRATRPGKQRVTIHPITAHSKYGFSEVLPDNEEIIKIMPAPGAGIGRMYSIYIRYKEEEIEFRETLGYEFALNQSPINWVRRAKKLCEMVKQAFENNDQDKEEGSDEDNNQDKEPTFKIMALGVNGPEPLVIKDPELVKQIKTAVMDTLFNSSKNKDEEGKKEKGKQDDPTKTLYV